MPRCGIAQIKTSDNFHYYLTLKYTDYISTLHLIVCIVITSVALCVDYIFLCFLPDIKINLILFCILLVINEIILHLKCLFLMYIL